MLLFAGTCHGPTKTCCDFCWLFIICFTTCIFLLIYFILALLYLGTKWDNLYFNANMMPMLPHAVDPLIFYLLAMMNDSLNISKIYSWWDCCRFAAGWDLAPGFCWGKGVLGKKRGVLSYVERSSVFTFFAKELGGRTRKRRRTESCSSNFPRRKKKNFQAHSREGQGSVFIFLS